MEESRLIGSPTRPTDPIHLADWLEISTLLAPDLSSSAGDLMSVLTTQAVQDLGVSPEDLAGEAFAELTARSISARGAYPFSIEGSLVRQTPKWEAFGPYVFCLLLSFFGYGAKRADVQQTAKLFENLAAVAANQFLDTGNHKAHSAVFGFPRMELPPGFREAVDEVCRRVGDGQGCISGSTRNAKDENLDIVAWRDFPDMLTGKLLLFGQCAGGSDWAEKLGDLEPDDFCKKWMREAIAGPVLKAYFLPHRIVKSRWRHATIDGGILFDRCRIAFLTQGTVGFETHVAWAKSRLKGLK